MFSIRIHAIEASVDNKEVIETLNEFGDILGVTFDMHECDRTNSVMGEVVVDEKTYNDIIDSGKYRKFVDTLDELDGNPISFYVLFMIRSTGTNGIVDNVLW